ncbi:uncharacterized protein LOC141686539 [Apium graveolens]|uniref:uncharacterized protein LOC141686539 n=1 Tax=Apium graveolens TaxID=4045 RepID=UPI003D7A0FAC
MRNGYVYILTIVSLILGLTPHLAGCLWQQYVVDQFAAIEQYRLDWVSTHQTTIRADLYNSVRDALSKGDHDSMHIGKAVILPASFTGSQRYMSQYFKDSLAICRAIGHPSLFLTMTCNSKWPEIQEMLKLLPNVDPVDAPDIVSRVFKLKLDQLLDLIKKKNYFGKCIGVMHVIEFQKRDLPHVHMLIWLSPESRPNSIEKVDRLVSAEIPDKNSDPIAYEAVRNYMMHGPCGKDLYTSPCIVKRKCMRHFPKRFNGNTYFDDCGFPVYRRRNTGRVINKKGINLDNQYVVPYNRDLLLRFQCHINLEICNSSRSLKYLFKYCLKGHDTATMLLKKKSNKSGSEQTARSVKNLDEVKNFLDGRYVCASEASWRIFGFDIHHRSPSVERLPIHLPGQKYLNFQSSADLENVCNNATSKKSKLEAWFVANSEFPQARNFTYSDFPTQFTWIKKTVKWKLRQRGDVVGRLAEVHATTGELFHLRMLLLRCKGALSFSQLRTIDGTTYDTFKEACGALVSDPLALWEKHWPTLSDDVLYIRRKISDNIHLTLSEYEIQNYALAEIEKLLNDVGGMFFVYGSGGCGKTFLWQTLCSRFRSEGKIVLPVASSGIATTLLPGGRIAHSRFKIPLKLDQSSIAGIKHGTDIAELMQHTSLIIWDEAPMQHRYAIEAVDRSLRDIMAAVDVERGRRPFGGITVVFEGDFRQIFPVLPKAGRAEIVNASFNKSRLWKSCRVFLLSQNMRLHSDVETEFVVPDEYVVKSPLKSPIKTLIDIIYPDFQNNLHSQEYLRSRSILTPTNVVVDDINAQILERVSGNMHTYLSQDSIEDKGVDENDFDSSFPVEYLNSINMPCMPKHELKVKDHHHLSDLDGNNTAWTLKVRVTRMWVSTNRQGVLVRHNLILLDCENNHILAIIPPALWNLFYFIIHPGRLLRIRNVQVLPAAGFMRPVRSANHIIFLPITVVVLEPEKILSIPRHKFDLVHVTLLYNSPHCSALDELPIYSTDVIGIVELLLPVQSIMTRFGEKEVLRFRISDGVRAIQVCFSGSLPTNFESLYQVTEIEPKIVILASVRVFMYRGRAQISNIPSTKVFVNLDYPDVLYLRQRLTDI